MRVSRSVLARYWEADKRNDSEALRNLRHPEWVAEWPQSGERIRGHRNDRMIHENYPGYPAHELRSIAGQPEQWALSPLGPVRISGEGDLWIGEALFTYPDGPYHTVGIFELRDGLVRRETVYWAEPFEPPAWRAKWVETIPEGGSLSVGTQVPSEEEQRRRLAIERYFRAPMTGETHATMRALYQAGMRELFHEDAVQDLPQSGERIRGLANMLTVVDRHPDFPMGGELRRVVGTGDLFVLEAKLKYSQATYWEALLMEFRGERVARTTEYYAVAFEPPGWRAPWVERM